jgi:hypothetical protein
MLLHIALPNGVMLKSGRNLPGHQFRSKEEVVLQMELSIGVYKCFPGGMDTKSFKGTVSRPFASVYTLF